MRVFGRGKGGCWHKRVFYCKVQGIDARSGVGEYNNLDYDRLVASSKIGYLTNSCRLDTRQATSLLERKRLRMFGLSPSQYNNKVTSPMCRMTVLAATALLQSAVDEITRRHQILTLQLPLKLFVYNDDHEEVAKCVPTNLSKAALNSEAKWHGMHEKLWRDHNMDRFKEFTLDLPENVNGFLISNNPLFDCLPRREKHMLLMLEVQFPVQGLQVEDEIFDLSQCVSRFHKKKTGRPRLSFRQSHRMASFG